MWTLWSLNNLLIELWLQRIGGELQKYQMISRTEVAEVQRDIMQRMNNMSDEQKRMFENMRPSLAFRVRTVLKGSSAGKRKWWVRLETKDPFSIFFFLSPAIIASKLEVTGTRLHITMTLGDLEAAMKIAESLKVASNPFGIADCVEIVKLHFNKEVCVASFLCWMSQASTFSGALALSDEIVWARKSENQRKEWYGCCSKTKCNQWSLQRTFCFVWQRR